MSAALQKLREPFAPNQISYLPKGGVKLAYVGHAALTDRLLDVDPQWSWEPLALDQRGLPAIDECGGLWIKLTVCGVTRLGYGDAGTKKGGDAMKERIGDALRNAAMRFGAALDLWHKGELHAPEVVDESPVSAARMEELAELAADMLQLANEDRGLEAVKGYYSLPNNDEKIALWGMLKGDGKGSTPESRLRALIRANSPHN